jgi:hypothetical protein
MNNTPENDIILYHFNNNFNKNNEKNNTKKNKEKNKSNINLKNLWTIFDNEIDDDDSYKSNKK